MQVFCVICLECCAQEGRLSVITNCGHVFHTACLTRWLGENLNCPHCRRDARGNAIKNLFIVAGPEAPTPPRAEHEARMRAQMEAANQKVADLAKINSLTKLLKDQAKNHKERMDLMAQQTMLQVNRALERYK